jgi:hypothetical protein
MSNRSFDQLITQRAPLVGSLHQRRSGVGFAATATLAAALTNAASKQTYYTIRFLVDRDQVDNAYRAYAYFRWLDDRLDGETMSKSERMAFVERQSALVDSCYRGRCQPELSLEERMVFDLIHSDQESHSGLRSYIQSMMAVMAFDAARRDTLVPEQELTAYSRHLATAVTEALHYFIGHDQFSPHSEARYLAVTAAHITHMLRDTLEDTAAGYYNIPREYLETNAITARDINSDPYRAWVQSRVELARAYFEAGRNYLAQVESIRCRTAGYAYIARFEGVLESIERDGWRLRAEYLDRKRPGMVLRMLGSTFSQAFIYHPAEVAAQGSVTG